MTMTTTTTSRRRGGWAAAVVLSLSSTTSIHGFTTTIQTRSSSSSSKFGGFGRGTSASRTTSTTPGALCMSTTTTTTASFIDTELRGAAMRLHTTKQAPKEGKVQAPEPSVPYEPTHEDYVQFLVDSQHVYQALEDIVNEHEELSMFRNTGLERVQPLEVDITWMCQEFHLSRPPVGKFGTDYATHIRNIIKSSSSQETNIPQFMCHYYNFYFAHTAGGRMIGKRMASLLLNKKTLEFYKWNSDLNKLKASVKAKIEDMAARWDDEQKQQCVDGTAMAFRGGGGINAYLSGGKNNHH